MYKVLDNECIIIKSFNNNVILTRINEKETILLGKGIGFGKKEGDILKTGLKYEKAFFIEGQENLKDFNKLIERENSNLIGLCEELICDIEKQLGEVPSERIHISLTDHLIAALKRLENGEPVDNPFVVEIQTLYSTEYEIAKNIAKKIEERSEIFIPEGEIGFIALHIHSARNDGKLSNTIKYAYIGSAVIEEIEELLQLKIDRTGLDYARFLTHIRFAIERIIKDVKIENDFVDLIKIKYRKSYTVAIKVSKIIEKALDKKINNDELAYMALHIQRFINCKK